MMIMTKYKYINFLLIINITKARLSDLKQSKTDISYNVSLNIIYTCNYM